MKFNFSFRIIILSSVIITTTFYNGKSFSSDIIPDENGKCPGKAGYSFILKNGNVLKRKCCKTSQYNISDNSTGNEKGCSLIKFDLLNRTWIKGNKFQNNDINCTIKTVQTIIEIRHIFYSGDELYYIGSDKNASSDDDYLILGYLNNKTGLSFSRKTQIRFGSDKVEKMFGNNDAVYILFNNNILHRISLNSMNVSIRNNVLDFDFKNGKIILVENRNKSFYLNYNGEQLPLSITDDVKIKELLDCRILIVSNKTDSEILDINLMKSLYQYSSKKKYKFPEKFNIVLNVVDSYKRKIRKSDKKLVFYKLYVNGKYKGRTETGLAFADKKLKLKVDPGKFYIIRAERWKLDRKGSMYVRANNIYQPETIRIFIPENRIIKIDVVFTGRVYKFKKSVATE